MSEPRFVSIYKCSFCKAEFKDYEDDNLDDMCYECGNCIDPECEHCHVVVVFEKIDVRIEYGELS